MTPEQFSQLLNLLEKIAFRPYTITQATDWPMVMVFFGVFGVMFSLSIGLFWRYVGSQFGMLKEVIVEFKATDCKGHETLKTEYEKGDKLIWDAMEKCQNDCCPRGLRI